MTEWKRKRFWSSVETTRADGGFAILLDDRLVRTPSKDTLLLPSRALADAVAREWQAQEGEIDPGSMPMTRLANSALEKVAIQQSAVADHVAEYGGTDLLCYRAENPPGLVARQAEHWGALVDWAADDLGVKLEIQSGLMPIAQPAASQQEIRRRTRSLDPFELTALHELVTLSGSWIIGYAALTGARDTEELWQAAIIDEIWQEEQWGEDADAIAARNARREAFLTARLFARLTRST